MYKTRIFAGRDPLGASSADGFGIWVLAGLLSLEILWERPTK